MEGMVQRSAKTRLGEVEIESVAVPYIDLRAEPRDTVEEKLAQLVAETTGTGPQPDGLRTLVITEPPPSDALAVALARQGIRVIVGPTSVPLRMLLDRFCKRLRTIGAGGSLRSRVSGGTAEGRLLHSSSRSQSPYAQNPPWFDQSAFDERNGHPFSRSRSPQRFRGHRSIQHRLVAAPRRYLWS